MKNAGMARRDFLRYSAAAAAAAGLPGTLMAQSDVPKTGLKKSLQLGMLPKELPDADKFALAKACGFEGIEASPMEDLEAAKALGDAARAAGVPIQSLCYGGWGAPMSDPNPDTVKKGQAEIEVALRSAKAMGAEVVLLVPAVVSDKVPYDAAYTRSQENIRPLLPLAEELGVVIAVENVWNKFLLSPLEFARYVDEFGSPWLRAYFDVGNVVVYGWPEQWIRILGSRIARVHLKDFKREGQKWTNLRDGDVNWPEVLRAFQEVGYNGYATTELGGGDEAYLRDLSKRIDLINEGK